MFCSVDKQPGWAGDYQSGPLWGPLLSEWLWVLLRALFQGSWDWNTVRGQSGYWVMWQAAWRGSAGIHLFILAAAHSVGCGRNQEGTGKRSTRPEPLIRTCNELIINVLLDDATQNVEAGRGVKVQELQLPRSSVVSIFIYSLFAETCHL